MAANRYQEAIATLDDCLAGLAELDDHYRMVALRTDDPHIIREVKGGRRGILHYRNLLITARSLFMKRRDEQRPEV